MTMAHRMFMAAAGTGLVFDFTLSSSEDNWVLDTELVTAGWNEADRPITVNITINSSIQIGSTSTGTAGMNLGTLPADSAINLTVGASGQINGKGGNGNSAQSAGESGGTALYTRSPTTLTNNAEINGGGGGGGGGATNTVAGNCPSPTTVTGSGGSGGAGYGNSSAVSGSSGGSQSRECRYSTGGPDASPCNTISGTYAASGGGGGAGGDKGTAGGAGGSGSRTTKTGCTSGSTGSAGGGGAAGSAVDGHSYITYATTGTINGAQVN